LFKDQPFTGRGKTELDLAAPTRNVMRDNDLVFGKRRHGEMAATGLGGRRPGRAKSDDLAPANRSPARGAATAAAQY